MRVPSRSTCTALLAACFLFLAGCGDSSNAFAWESEASEPKGDPIKIRYEMEKGEGVRMVMSMNGKLEMSGDMEMSTPMNMTMTMAMVCEDVLDNGDRVMVMEIEKIDASASELGGDLDMPLEDFKGRITISPEGKVSNIEMSGLEPSIQGQVDQMLNSGGFQTFVPMPPEGLRVGQAIDMAKVLPKEALETMMSAAAAGGANIKPEVKGEMVLKGTKKIDGEDAAEFGINLVMNVAGTMSQGGSSAKMDMGMKMSGTQFSSLRTGYPAGSSKVKMQMRMSIESDDSEIDMNMTSDVTIRCTKIKK